MEQKDIVFDKGIHREPSVSISDAELSECVNLIPSHGELVNMRPPVEVGIELNDGEVLLAIHETSEYKHYITSYSGGLYWGVLSGEEFDSTKINVSSVNLKQVVAVGNALALIYEQSANIPMGYLLWKDSGYIVMGQMPDVKLDFGLSGNLFVKNYENSVIIKDANYGSFFNDLVTSITTPKDYDKKLVEYYDADFDALGLELNKPYRIENSTERNVKFNDDVILWNSSNTYTFTKKELIIKYSLPVSIKVTNLALFIYSKSENGKILEQKETQFKKMTGALKDYINYVHRYRDCFIFPFFIRYAVKLFDGSYSHISEPIYMLPNDGIVPFFCQGPQTASLVTAITAIINATCSISSDIENWKDIILGVSIGITSPIYRIDLGAEYDDSTPQGTVVEYSNASLSENYGYINNEKTKLKDLIESKNINPDYIYFPPSFSKGKFKENIKNTSVFYIIKTYSLEELSQMTNGIKVDLPSCGIDKLETLPTLPDEYNSSNEFYPKGGFSYNNRLNIYDVKQKLVNPVLPVSPVESLTSLRYDVKYYIFIRESGKDIVVGTKSNKSVLIKWVYYGNINAYKCRIVKLESQVDPKYVDIPLSPHPWLNGACAIVEDGTLNWQYTTDKTVYEPTSVVSATIIKKSNALYASNAANPFFFPVELQNQIGTGKINAISTATKALSQGQYGQFPLYAFTDDGIWSLAVDEQGKYSTSNPLNRDVVKNPDSICQIDDSVVYACSQGLKQLSGSETKLLTSAIEGRNVDEKLFFGLDENRTDISALDDNHSGLAVSDNNSIINYLDTCKVMYDPAGKRLLHVYPNTPNGKHYVYDIDNEEWTTEVGEGSNVKTIVPGYPFSTFVAEVSNGLDTSVDKLMQYTNTENNNVTRYGVILTRAYAMGDPFAMKMLCDLRLLYSKNNPEHPAKCKVAVFVSNDRVKWKQLKSLRKRSYKWYRFRIQTAMTDIDALTSMSMHIEPRRTNKLR